MKKIAIYFALISLIFLQGCDSYLDIKPKGKIIPQYFDDYVKIMASQSLYMCSAQYPNYITDDVQLGNANENKEFAFNLKRDSEMNLYSFAEGQVFTPGNYDELIGNAYGRIYVYNAVINQVMSVSDASESEKLRLKAEALVGRAYEYLILVNAYCNHYNESTAKTDIGVPLALSEDINQAAKYSTVQQVYDQIKSDLEEATPNLSEKVTHAYRPNKKIGYSFLAKMYLYLGKYEKALENAKEAIKECNKLVDYKLYTTKKGQWGRIVLASDLTTVFPDVLNNVENIYIRNYQSNIFKSVCASQDLIDTYKRDLPDAAIDQRMALFYCVDFMDTGRPMNFPGRTLYAPYINLNSGLTTAELYLIAAECEARIGDKDKAMEYINTLRNSRIKNNKQLMAADNNVALKVVLDERRREMAFNGITRLIDLKRLNRDARFNKTITHTADGKTWTLPPNDNRYILPIPTSILDFHPNMPVYPR